MLLRSLQKSQLSFSVLRAIKSYKNTATQQHMHEFDINIPRVQQIKRTIDYDTINKQSQGCIMIRQFLFQEKQTTYQVNFVGKNAFPTGKWSVQELQKMLDKKLQVGTPSEIENNRILDRLDQDLKDKLITYYNNIGKRNYTFSVKQEIHKIQSMTTEEFETFLITLNQ